MGVGFLCLLLLLGFEGIEFLLLLLPDFRLLIIIGLLFTFTSLFLSHLLHEEIMHVDLLVSLFTDFGLFAFLKLAFTSFLITKHLLLKAFILCLLDLAEQLAVQIRKLL